jgi:hypothetical protein
MRERPVVSLTLTEEQKAMIRRETGKDATALELSADELETQVVLAEMLDLPPSAKG